MSITLPSGVMLTQDEATHLEKEKAGLGYDTTKLKVEDKKGKFDMLHIKTRKCKTCAQSINISKEAYSYMVSNGSCPIGIKSFIWNKMKAKERLELHLALLCKDLGGTSYTYKVFDD